MFYINDTKLTLNDKFDDGRTWAMGIMLKDLLPLTIIQAVNKLPILFKNTKTEEV